MKKLIALVMLIFGACTTVAPTPTTTPPRPTASLEDVEFAFDGVTIELQQLQGWDIYSKSQNHLVMAEGDDPFLTSGGLEGLLVNIWVPTIHTTYDLDEHSIADILTLVLHNTSDIHNTAVVHDPIAFDWSGHDAAYYTLTHNNGDLSLILALKVADNHFLAVNISAPHGHGDRIRDALPMVFNPLHINGHSLTNEALQQLPAPLVFPVVTPAITPEA
jgi:hypothetical protein